MLSPVLVSTKNCNLWVGPTLEVHDLDFPSNLTNLRRIQNGCITYAQNCVQSGGDSSLGADQKDCGFRDENGEGYRRVFSLPPHPLTVISPDIQAMINFLGHINFAQLIKVIKGKDRKGYGYTKILYF